MSHIHPDSSLCLLFGLSFPFAHGIDCVHLELHQASSLFCWKDNTQQVDSGRLMKVWSSLGYTGRPSFVCLLVGWLVLVLKKMTNFPKVTLNLIPKSGDGMIMWQIYAILNGLCPYPGNLQLWDLQVHIINSSLLGSQLFKTMIWWIIFIPQVERPWPRKFPHGDLLFEGDKGVNIRQQ